MTDEWTRERENDIGLWRCDKHYAQGRTFPHCIAVEGCLDCEQDCEHDKGGVNTGHYSPYGSEDYR